MGERKRVILVDDSPDEAEFVRRAMARLHPEADLVVCRAGEEALDGLLGGDEDDQPPGADLVLLDLKLPRVDGHRILEALRERHPRGELPVVVFTSSREPGDLARAYALGANSYVAKPVSYDAYVEVIGDLLRYWLHVNVRAARPQGDRHV